MIVVDSSAIIAILRVEPERDAFLEKILTDSAPLISAASVMECSIVFRALKQVTAERAEGTLDALLQDCNLAVRPISLDNLSVARTAHIRYGKGSGHPAQLNFGDCFSYALAKSLGVPLLFKGRDFARTDIARAI